MVCIKSLNKLITKVHYIMLQNISTMQTQDVEQSIPLNMDLQMHQDHNSIPKQLWLLLLLPPPPIFTSSNMWTVLHSDESYITSVYWIKNSSWCMLSICKLKIFFDSNQPGWDTDRTNNLFKHHINIHLKQRQLYHGFLDTSCIPFKSSSVKYGWKM
jgi:hypothetical protein